MNNRHDVITPPTIIRLLLNLAGRCKMTCRLPMTMHKSKSKPEIKFQYGGRPFSETESNYISAVDWVTSLKFDTHIDFHFLKQIPSLILNPEVHFRLYGRHHEKSIWRHNSTADRPITTKYGRHMQNDMSITILSSKSKQRTEFQYGGRRFPKPEVVLSQPWTEISLFEIWHANRFQLS